jgi:hypothetical protein
MPGPLVAAARSVRPRVARLGILLLLAYAACGGPGGDPADAGSTLPRDASSDPFDGAVAPPEEGAACYDAIDNDSDSNVDCDEAACAGPVCCVGSGAAECCAEAIAEQLLVLDACSDGPAPDCITGGEVALFGSVLPAIEDGGLVPQGGSGYGGAALASPIDPRAVNLSVRASVIVPPTASRCTDCADGAGIALFGELPDGSSRVLAGVIAMGSRNELLVVAADEIIHAGALAEGAHALEIVTDVEGGVIVKDGSVELGRLERLSLPSRVWPAVYGRTENRAEGVEAVRVESASVSTSECEAPAALMRRTAPVVPWSGASWDPDTVRAPSLASWEESGETRTLMVFAYGGQIYSAGPTDLGEFRGDGGDPGEPLFTLPAELVVASDPAIVADAGQLHLFFVGTDVDGATSVWKTTGSTGLTPTFEAPLQVLDPAALGVTGIDGISVLASDVVLRMVARVWRDGSSRIVLLFSDPNGTSWQLPDGSLEAATLRLPQPDDLFAFDRDEVAAPARVRHTDVRGEPLELLYYAGRRGTRWSIGLLISEDGLVWRPIGPVLEGSGVGFDALGVTDPAPLVIDGAVHLFYAGTDGQGFRIGEAGPAGTVGE